MAGAFANATFVREAEDLLEQIEGATLERVPSDAESINLLFRAFHTIKGSSAMVGLDAIASFTHHARNKSLRAACCVGAADAQRLSG